LFTVSAQGGGSPNEPVLVHSGFTGHPWGVSRSGDFFYVGPYNGGFHQVIAERSSAGARIVQTFGGQSGMWSRGNKLAFVRPGQAGNDLIVRSMDTGEERLYQHAGIGLVSPRWLGDGSKAIVFITGEGDNGRPGGSFYLLEVNTGSFSRLFAKDTVDRVRSVVTVLSPDDKTLYTAVRANVQGAPWTGIVGLDLATGAERSVLTLPGSGLPSRNAPGLAISPDGNTLAIDALAEGSSTDGRILTVRTDGSDLRELVGRMPSRGGSDVMRWTPDGQFILFVAGGNPLPGGWRVMRIPVSGGEPEFDGLDSSRLESAVPLPLLEVGNVASIDLSPDGSRIVFSSWALATHDIWTIENVMSAVGRRR
jgi:Tol biopolymer transport system component